LQRKKDRAIVLGRRLRRSPGTTRTHERRASNRLRARVLHQAASDAILGPGRRFGDGDGDGSGTFDAMTPALDDLPDPRSFPSASSIPPWAADVHGLAAKGLDASTGQAADALAEALSRRLRQLLEGGDGESLAALLRLSPSVAIHRHVARALARLARRPGSDDDPLALTLFALPVVVVAATSSRENATVRIPGILADAAAVRAVLQQHHALGGNESFAIGNALAASDTIDIRRLPSLLATRMLSEDRPPLDVAPADIEVVAEERAHLRFLVGSAIAAPGVDLFPQGSRMPWAMPLARELIAQLSRPGVSIVALPRGPADLATALSQGVATQRDVSAQLFASNALRSLRAEAGEPSAVISAHHAPDAPGGGELRLSLSSPLAPRAAQGFRCAILPAERVVDVATMLVDLMRDCRVADVRIVRGVHADRDALTGGPLLFKPETLPQRAVH
jgi:hypothetical protein